MPSMLTDKNDQETVTPRCLDAWTKLDCALCDPKVGTYAHGPPPIAAKLCNSVYDSCKEEFFAAELSGYPVPCGSKHTVCSKMGEWYEDGPHLCRAVGFEPVDVCTGSCSDGVTFPALPTLQRSARRGTASSQEAEQSNRYLLLLLLGSLFCIVYYTNWSNLYSFLQGLFGFRHSRGRGRKLGRR